MAIIKKTLFPDNLDKIPTSYTDVDPSSKYFKITELPETFTGGKNAFLIQGSEYLVADSLIKIELKDANGDIIYHEPGEGIISASVNGEPIITEYYEGVSKLVSVYIYPDTAYGPCTLTILGELASYDNNGINTPVSAGDEGYYNVKWQKQINVNPSLANTTKIRFYKRPTAKISEILSPIYKIENDLKVASAVTQSFANIKLSNLETFAGDVKRVKVFRTSVGDISDYDMIQDILVESKELLTSYGLSGSVVGNTGIFTSEVLKNQWNSGSLNATLNSTKVEAGVRLTGSGLFTYTQSLDLKNTNTYELNLDAFYSASTDSNLGIYLISGSTSSSIGTLIGTQPTKNLLDTTIPFKIDRDYPTASLYFSQSQGQWHLGNISLRLSQDTAFSPDEIGFITTMPTVLGNETFNFKFEFYDINNNYVPVEVTQSALFNGGNTNIGGTILLISSSASSSLADLNRVSSSISGTVTFNSSSANTTIVTLSGSVSSSITVVSGSVVTLSGSVSGTIGVLSGSVSGTIGVLSGSVSASITSLSSSVSTSIGNAKADAFARVQQLANGGYPGTFIENDSIYSPVIGGQLGYFSTLFKVGTTPSIYLDARQNPRKIFIGGIVNPSDTTFNEYSGAFNNTNTPVYLDSTGKLSLGNKLSWNGSALSVTGEVVITSGTTKTAIDNAASAASTAQTTADAASAAAIAVDGKVFTDSSGKLAKTPSPTSSGLYLGSTFLGYYNGSAWKTYMANNGNFFLSGTGTNGLSWDGTTLNITGNLAVGSSVPNSAVSGLGSLATRNSVSPADGITGLGGLATRNSVSPADGITGLGGLATRNSVSPADGITGLGGLATLNTVTNAELANDAVTEAKIAINAVTSGKISANAVVADKIAANAIVADKIAAGSITAGKIVAGAISADKIAANAITADRIAADTITAANIASLSFTGKTATFNQGTIGGWTMDGSSLKSVGNVISLNAVAGGGWQYGNVEIGSGAYLGVQGSFSFAEYIGGNFTYREAQMPFMDPGNIYSGNDAFSLRVRNQNAGQGAILALAASTGNTGLHTNGGVRAYRFTQDGGGYTNGSDRRLKDNINKLNDKFGIEFINKLNPVEFVYKKTPQYKKFGFIAQEVSSSLLDYDMNMDNSTIVQCDESSKDKTLTIDYTEFIIPLIKSVQQLSKKVEELEMYISGSINK